MRMLMMLGLMCTAVTPTTASDSFKLVDGDTQAVIVGNDHIQSRLENGYKTQNAFLRHYIEQSTGRRLQKINEADYDESKHPYAIFLGNTKTARERHGAILKTQDRDAYVVQVTPNAVYLCGARRHSDEYAMFDFLQEELGIATYIPTSWGTIVPKHERVVIKPSYRLEVPAFNSRAFSCLRTYRDNTTKLNYSGNTDIPWRIYRRDTFSHHIHWFIPVKEFGKTNPEYFPEVNGKRIIVSKSTSPGPCISNPGVVEVIIRKTRAFFDDPKNKEKDIISLGMTDGGWCECAQCKALDGPDITGNERSKGARYYWMLNQVGEALAKTHPDKSIGVLAYAGADYPPANMKISRNIVPYICLTRANWGDIEVQKEHLWQTMEWASRVNKIGTYEYLYGAGFMVPRLYNSQMAEYLRYVRSQGNGGFYAEIYSNHALDGPKAWIVQELLWNPYQDPNALLDQWCKVLFEESADPMNRYFTFLEKCNTENILRSPNPDTRGKDRSSKFHMLQDEAQFDLFNPSEIEHAQSLLAEADAATNRAAIKERIKYFADGMRVTAASVKAYHAYRKAKELYANKAGDEKVLAALIEGQANGPDEDPILLMQELTEADSSTFTPVMPVAISTSTELSMRLIDNEPWNAVYGMLKQGVKDRQKLIAAAKEKLLAIAPKNWEADTVAKQRMQMLLAMSERIAVAHRVTQPPTIDADVSDPTWQWQVDGPWWQWKSGMDYNERTETAFCHDGKTLYVAVRCYQKGLDKAKTVEGYGAAAWKYISMELHLNPDERDASKDDIDRYQVIPAIGGGIYSRTHDVVKAWKVSHTAEHWQAEMALDLEKIKMTPDKFAALRMNLIRNTRERGHYGKGWFPSSTGHANYHARGWLVFE